MRTVQAKQCTISKQLASWSGREQPLLFQSRNEKSPKQQQSARLEAAEILVYRLIDILRL